MIINEVNNKLEVTYKQGVELREYIVELPCI